MIFPDLQFDSNGGDRALLTMFQEGLLAVLKGGSVPLQ